MKEVGYFKMNDYTVTNIVYEDIRLAFCVMNSADKDRLYRNVTVYKGDKFCELKLPSVAFNTSDEETEMNKMLELKLQFLAMAELMFKC
ncbi:hypothetical protein [Caudoviricetes sp.]|nr:hypothetical protein [Caudoviricetes sp.]